MSKEIKSIKFYKTYGTHIDLYNYDPICTSIEIFYDGFKWKKRIIHSNITINKESCLFRYNNPYILIEEDLHDFEYILNKLELFNKGELIEYLPEDYLFAPYMGKWQLNINGEKKLSGSNRISYVGVELIKKILDFDNEEKRVLFDVLNSIENEREKILYAIAINLYDLDFENMRFDEKYELVKNLISENDYKKRII